MNRAVEPHETRTPDPRAARRSGAALGALLATALVCGPARAHSGRLELEFRAPPECGSAEQVQSAVATLVRSERPALKAAIEIDHVGDVYVANVRTAPGAERELTASSCHAVMEAASVVLALAIDPSGVAPAQRDRVSQREPSAPVSLSERSLQPMLVAALSADSSTLPRPALGGMLSAGLAWPRWSASATFTGWYPQDAWLSPTRGGRFTWWTGGLAVCASPFDPLWVAICVAPEIGRLAGTGVGDGLSKRGAASATWFAVGVGPALEWRFSANWALRGGAVAEATLLGRHPFVLELGDSTALVHRPGRLSARASFGVAARF